jgi:hypothetical protein
MSTEWTWKTEYMTIYNGIEQVTHCQILHFGVNFTQLYLLTTAYFQ